MKSEERSTDKCRKRIAQNTPKDLKESYAKNRVKRNGDEMVWPEFHPE